MEKLLGACGAQRSVVSPRGSCDGGRGAGEAAGSAGLCWRRGLGAFLQAKFCIAPEGGEPFGGTRSKVTATTALPSCLLPPSSALMQAGSSEEKAFCQLPPHRLPLGSNAAPPTFRARFWQTGFLHQHDPWQV